MNIKELIDRVIEDGVVTAHEHKMVLDAVSQDGVLDQDEAREIKRLMQLISEGKVTIK